MLADQPERSRLPAKPQLPWLFFSLSGRVGPSVYVLAGLLLVLAQFFPLYQLSRLEPGSAPSQNWALVFWVVFVDFDLVELYGNRKAVP